jgi:circadian clock protein KaiC
MQRSKTGIQGLDTILAGGLPEHSLTLLSGTAGTGKSILSMHFLVNGAKLYGERCLYISTEQTEEELQKAASQFGWDLVDLENKNLLRMIFFQVLGEDHFLKKIDELVQTFKPKRIVIDSLTTLVDSLLMAELQKDEGFSMIKVADTVSPIPRTEQVMTKIMLYNLFNQLKSYDSTILLTSEIHEINAISGDGVSEFVVDGVIVLTAVEGEDGFRTLRVPKMRFTKQKRGIYNFEITDNGVIVNID